jgi:hypothetical protein
VAANLGSHWMMIESYQSLGTPSAASDGSLARR